MPIVDTHAHIYSEDVKQYPQISDPYLPASGYGNIQDLKKEVKRNNVDRVVVVQTFTEPAKLPITFQAYGSFS